MALSAAVSTPTAPDDTVFLDQFFSDTGTSADKPAPLPSSVDTEIDFSEHITTVAAVLENLCLLNEVGLTSSPASPTPQWHSSRSAQSPTGSGSPALSEHSWVSTPSPPSGSTSTPPTPGSLFHAPVRPGVAVRDYLHRIYKFAGCSDTSLILALIYIDRLILTGDITLNCMTIHRLLIAAVCVAAKFFDDVHYTNTHYSQVGGIPLKELNTLEKQLLFSLDFSLHVQPEIFEQYLQQILPEPAATASSDNDVDSNSVVVSPLEKECLHSWYPSKQDLGNSGTGTPCLSCPEPPLAAKAGPAATLSISIEAPSRRSNDNNMSSASQSRHHHRTKSAAAEGLRRRTRSRPLNNRRRPGRGGSGSGGSVESSGDDSERSHRGGHRSKHAFNKHRPQHRPESMDWRRAARPSK